MSTPGPTPVPPAISPDLLAILVCPACRASLTLGEDTLACTGCGLVYPVREGIPILLVDEASPPS